MLSSYRILQSEETGEPVLLPTGSWDETYTRLMSEKGILGLRLSSSMGWLQQDLGFLSKLEQLQELEIYMDASLELSVVTRLTNLRNLAIECSYYKGGLSLAELNLKYLYLIWRKNVSGLSCQTGLKRLFLKAYPQEDVGLIEDMKAIEWLGLSSRFLTRLSGAGKFRSLREVKLIDCSNLRALSGLEGACNIERLTLHNCSRVTDIDAVGELKSLRYLILDSCKALTSIKPLSRLQNLEVLSIGGTTQIADGDTTPILELQKLKSLCLVDRKGYNYKRREIVDFLGV